MTARIDIVISPSARAFHMRRSAYALAAGLAVHGIEPRIVATTREADTDIVAVWGWRRGLRALSRGAQRVLVMECAYVFDRVWWISLGWDGLNGRAKFPAPDDGGARWHHHFAGVLHPWREDRGGYALLMGQVPTDMAVRGFNYRQWLCDTAGAMQTLGYDVRFRPHPLAPQVECGAPVLGGTLEAALAGARFVVTANSNSGVDAVLAGVPAVTLDEGAMAWDVTSHDLAAPVVTPDRSSWAHRLAWCQWLPQEVSAGDAWEHLKALL